MERPFQLDPRLEADTRLLKELPLSSLLLMLDSRFPWLILAPRRTGITELHQLGDADRRQLLDEAVTASKVLEAVYSPDKINLGALGNMVPQLHLHVVARSRGDAAWPGPVWGAGAARPYDDAALEKAAADILAHY